MIVSIKLQGIELLATAGKQALANNYMYYY